jgi:hypothetical protein
LSFRSCYLNQDSMKIVWWFKIVSKLNKAP